MNDKRAHQTPKQAIRVAVLTAVTVALLIPAGAITAAAAEYDKTRPIHDRTTVTEPPDSGDPGGGDPGGGDPGGGDPPPPARQVALGMAMNNSRDLATLDQFTASNGGHQPALWSVWSAWGEPATRDFPTETMNGLRDRNVTPYIFWEPWDPAAVGSRAYRYETIVAGNHDSYIREFARDAKALGSLVILRFAHEANGQFFPWGVGRTDNTLEQYLAAWRHVWTIFRQENANNVKFLWSVAKQSCSGGCNPYTPFYPGDKYVDYMGFSAFNWGTISGKQWTSMYDKTRVVTGRLSSISGKPIIVAENGSNHVGGDKGAWINEGYREVYNKLPAIVAIVYLNVDLTKLGHPDWSLSAIDAGLANYTTISGLPKFKGKITLQTFNRVKVLDRTDSKETKKKRKKAKTQKKTDTPKSEPRVHKGSGGSGAGGGSLDGQKAKTTKKRRPGPSEPLDTLDTMQR